LAKLLSAAILCKDTEKPCGTCTPCRKVFVGTHPDVITVTDPEHKNVAVKIVREIREDMFVRPNEAEKKIYIFPQELGVEGQNALLKILEEPPSYGVFILLSNNPETLLPTVRSRATELRLQALDTPALEKELTQRFPDAESSAISAAIDRSGGYLGQAITLLEQGNTTTPQTEGFVNAFSQKQPMELLNTLVPMEKWDRERFIGEMNLWLHILQQALICRSGMAVTSLHAQTLSAQRSAPEVLEGIRHLQKAIEYAQGNVSVAAICGYLVWALR
jgi:DNA polymerase-3 subunit delta'